MRATGGVTNRRERVRMIVGGVGLLLRTLPARLKQLVGLRDPKAIVYDLERLPLPDSPEARRSEQLLAEVDSPMILNHSYRTYIWGALLGLLADQRPDYELFYVAALLHDLTLTDKYRDSVPQIRCFAGKGAATASDWARQWGWSERRAEALGDAISLHLNTDVPLERGVEAHLLQGGAALDVIGHQHWRIAPQTMSAVLHRYPRLGMKENGLPLFARVSLPGTRTEVLNRRLQFPTLVRYSQFDD